MGEKKKKKKKIIGGGGGCPVPLPPTMVLHLITLISQALSTLLPNTVIN